MSMHDKDGKPLYDHMGQLTDAGIQHFVDAGKGKPDSAAPGGDVRPTLTDCSVALDAAVDVICELTGERRGLISDDYRADHLYDAANRIFDISRSLLKPTPSGAATGGDVEKGARELLEQFPLPVKVSSANGYDAAWAAGFNDAIDLCEKDALRTIIAALSAPKQVGGSDIYEAYKSWPADIRKKLSLQDLRRMSGWAPRTAVSDWRIDTSAGGPILVYQNCSVIEGEQARYVLGLIEKDSAPQPVEGMRVPDPAPAYPDARTDPFNALMSRPQPVEAEHDDWYTDPDTGSHVLDLDDNPSRQLSIVLKPNGTAVFAAYLDGEKIVGAVTEDFRDVVLRWAAPQPVEAEGREGNFVSRWSKAIRELPMGAEGREFFVLRPDGTHYRTDEGGAKMARARNGYRVLTESKPEQPAIDLEQFQWAANRWKKEAEYHANGIADDYGAGQRHAFFSCATELLAIIDGAKGGQPQGAVRDGAMDL